MKIGKFAELMKTTKHTVRHYEELELLTPEWDGPYKKYGEKEIADFRVILEMKDLGLALVEIQSLFKLKQALGCGDLGLLKQVLNQLEEYAEGLKKQEEDLKARRLILEEELDEIRDYFSSVNHDK
ncbi:MerR family transcriptional regulator [Falsibacillus pallidus]|uniref:MerR family Zn(II)-responsive transcriptional regulator of zntA n=1 Tax=Falsibacillus pallidus TaxID=493781 RepID=A0A370GUJ2_9BACI|nr:MerR family transcriptional regulator [Falsibacillus pallidus]RDI45603.1 MerR family Zn(II)-responsive transcriptional regulator of zntA [Falsibacillus pallidus]